MEWLGLIECQWTVYRGSHAASSRTSEPGFIISLPGSCDTENLVVCIEQRRRKEILPGGGGGGIDKNVLIPMKVRH